MKIVVILLLTAAFTATHIAQAEAQDILEAAAQAEAQDAVSFLDSPKVPAVLRDALKADDQAEGREQAKQRAEEAAGHVVPLQRRAAQLVMIGNKFMDLCTCSGLTEFVFMLADARGLGLKLDDAHLDIDQKVDVPSLRVILHKTTNQIYDAPADTPDVIVTKFLMSCEKEMPDDRLKCPHRSHGN